MIRMTWTQRDGNRVSADVIARWTTRPPSYDEYLEVARASYAALFAAFRASHGQRLRLGVPRRPIELDATKIDCNKVSYAAEKFSTLTRSLALGEGDARARLASAYWTFHVIRPEDLPPPLDAHLRWVYGHLTRYPGRHELEGSVDASLARMRNPTAAKLIERLVDLCDAIAVLDAGCEDSRRVPG